MLSEQQVQQFHNDGFLAVRQVLDGATLAALRSAVERQVQRSAGVTPEQPDPAFDLAPGHSAQTPRLNRINHPVVQDDAFAQVAASPAVLDIVAQLLGPQVKFHHSKLNMKSGGGGAEIGWHQDFAFFPHTNYDLLACGFALDDADTSNGCLLVVPGSHRLGLLSHRDAAGKFLGQLVDGARFEERLATPVELKAGDMSIHHVLAVHGSTRNDSPRQRRLFICQYAAGDAIQLDYRAPANAWSNRVLRGGPVTHARLAEAVTLPLRGEVVANSSIFRAQRPAMMQ